MYITNAEPDTKRYAKRDTDGDADCYAKCYAECNTIGDTYTASPYAQAAANTASPTDASVMVG